MRSDREIQERIKTLKSSNPFFIHYIRTIKFLNNEYYVTKLARQGLVTLREQLKEQDSFTLEIEVPSINGKEIKKEKDKSKVVKMLRKSIKSDLYSNSIISGVSFIEQFLESLIRAILIMHPGKLSVEVESIGSKKDLQEDKKIDLKDILSAKTLDDIYMTIINQKIYKLFYASPSDYFKYLNNVIQITLEADLIESYIEIKATRDLIIHNNGKVNQIYIQKSGKKGRATNTKQNIPINEEYYIQSFSVLKKIVRDSYEIASKVYIKETKKENLYI
jgi:hypothetical protein